MSSSKPLSYETTKIVLQYLDANRRFQLSDHCPSIRKTEKLVPLKVDNLGFDGLMREFDLSINNHKYQFAIFRKYPKGKKVPSFHKQQNEQGGVVEDFDKYGVPESYEIGKSILKSIQIEHSCISRLEGRGGARMSAVEPLTELETEKELNEHKANVEALENKRKKVLPRYELQIQLNITPSLGKQIKRAPYIFKLDEARKALVYHFFCGRKDPIFVNHLKADEEMFKILDDRWNLKFVVRSLCNNFEEMDIERFIHPRSLPLEKVEVEDFEETSRKMEHKIKKTAKKLVINTFKMDSSWYKVLPKQSNQAIFLILNSENSVGTCVRMFKNVVKHWLEYGREVGVTFSMMYKSIAIKTIMKEISKVSKEFNGEMINESSIFLPFNFTSKILVTSMLQDVETDDSLDTRFTYREEGYGILKLEVVPL